MWLSLQAIFFLLVWLLGYDTMIMINQFTVFTQEFASSNCSVVARVWATLHTVAPSSSGLSLNKYKFVRRYVLQLYSSPPDLNKPKIEKSTLVKI